jgi:hypothetical protein
MTMPKGKPNTQTKATDKYQKKAGIIAKTFKLKKEVVEAYKEACEKAGVSQAGQLTKMMNDFIEQVNSKQ